MIELSHLKIIQALAQNGTLTQAANALCLTQSALSHQIRYLEKKLEVKIWQKQGRNIRLTQSGQLLLQTAQQVLPVLSAAENTLKAYASGLQGHLRIGVECYPCYEWLTGVIEQFIQQMPDMELDIVNKFQFSGLEGLLNHHIDILVTPDWIKKEGVQYIALADYELVVVLSKQHPLAQKTYIQPSHLSQQTLYTFPVAKERLDILTHFLLPAHHMPKKLQEIESLDIMLKMTELQRGVCVLPKWLVMQKNIHQCLITLPVGSDRMFRTLYLAIKDQDIQQPFFQKFIEVAQQLANF